MDLMITQLLFFGAIIIGNIIRQFAPVVILLIQDETFKWDNTYTRRFAIAVIWSVGTAYVAFPQLALPEGTIFQILLSGINIGVTQNWLIELLGKLEWKSGQNAVTPTS